MSVELILILMFFVVLPLIQQLMEAARKGGKRTPEPGPAPPPRTPEPPPPVPMPRRQEPVPRQHEPGPVPPPRRAEAPRQVPGPVLQRREPAPAPLPPRSQRPPRERPVRRPPVRHAPPSRTPAPAIDRLPASPALAEVTSASPRLGPRAAAPAVTSGLGDSRERSRVVRAALRDPASVRQAVVFMTILGPCRANAPHEWREPAPR